MNVVLFVTDIGLAAVAKKAGSNFQRVPPKALIPTADAALGLNGALIAHFANRPMEFIDAPMMNDEQWKEYLDARFSGCLWNRWFGKTPSAIYSVVVASEIKSVPTSVTSLPPELRTVDLHQETERSKTSCKCGHKPASNEFLCAQCGQPIGWELICLPKRDEIKDLTCGKCSDVLIPSDAVFLLKILDVDISCPVCQTILDRGQRNSTWDLAFLDASPAMQAEDALLGFSRKAREKQLSLPAAGTPILEAVSAEEQLAGLLLLRWLEKHSSPSKAIIEDIAAHFLFRFKLGVFTTEGTKDLHVNVDFLKSMHYGSVFAHQVENRCPNVFLAHGARARLILNLMGSFPRWSSSQFQTLSYDGRLGINELVFSLEKDVKVHPGDRDKENVYKQFATLLFTAVPSGTDAVGCKKGGTAGCFIATAAYTPDAPEVQTLRSFRDRVLLNNQMGRKIVNWYYRWSPPAAQFIKERKWRRSFVKVLLKPVVWLARRL